MRVEPLAILLVPVSMSLVPSFDEPQPARTSAHNRAGRTRILCHFLKGALTARGAAKGLIPAGRGGRNGMRLARRPQLWLISEGLKGLPVRSSPLRVGKTVWLA